MSASFCTLLDMPDHVLVNIISHFNARKRLILAQVCVRFNSLIFGDKELLHNLDFSKNGRLTTAMDIVEYFGRENTCKFVRRVNLQNVICMKPGDMLNNSIGKATNLVDLNIHELDFEDVKQVLRFLEPLVCLKRLSIDWPQWETKDLPTCLKVLRKPFSKLRYLSVYVFNCSEEFLSMLLICQELEELRIVAGRRYSPHDESTECISEYNQLPNLQKFYFHGSQPNEYSIEPAFAILANPAEWTQFQLINEPDGFFIAKNVQVCEQLRGTQLMRSLPYKYNPRGYGFGWNFTSESLLTEVLRITHEDTPKTFCCFSTRFPNQGQTPGCLLKIREAEQLLRDPSYAISFLYFKHSIEPNCDAHLIASAFPNLTGLYLTNVLSSRHKLPRQKRSNKCLTRRGDSTSERLDDPTSQASSFRMLVENTPNVRDLTIFSKGLEEDFDESWDFEVFDLIPHWKNLTALRLLNIYVIDDGKFLAAIGEQCSKLETIYLVNLADCFDYGSCCYMNSLTLMLNHCENLREFCIKETYIDKMPELLIALSNKRTLKKVHIFSINQDCDSVSLISSFEQLLNSCPKLTTLVLIMEDLREKYYGELEEAFLRLVLKLDRPKFQFQGPRPNMPVSVYSDAPFSHFPSMLN